MTESTLVCTWQSDVPEDDQLETFIPEQCGQEAVAIYWKKNPRRREPDQPRDLTYPSCKRHDTPSRRKAATEQGYNREAL